MRRAWFAVLLAALFAAGPLQAQAGAGRITGTVVSAETGEPLQGVTVSVMGTNLGVLTGPDGRYTFDRVTPGRYQVAASQIGYETARAPVVVTTGGTASADFRLQTSAIALEGVTAIGYGEQRQERVTGAVTTLTPEEFNPGRVISPEQLIAAKVAGVQVVDTGEPGGGINLRIRGGTSINASNEPLYVIDGVPLPAGGGLSAGRNPLNFLNPENIENITILKDASATAIYGSRGANGVVLIETKSGDDRGPQFAYSGSLSSSTLIDEPDYLSADQFRQVVAERAPNLTPFLGNASTDWRDALLRDAFGQEHNVAFSGAGQDMRYRLSVGYLDQAGVVLGSVTERVTGSINYNHSLFNDRLNVAASVRGARTDDEFTPGGGLAVATQFDPTQPIFTDAGYFQQLAFGGAPTNPVAELDLGVVEGTTYRGLGSIAAEYRLPFVDGLAATTRLSFDVANSERREFYPVALAREDAALPGFVGRSSPRETTGVLDAFLTYASALEGLDSQIDATAGYSYETSRGDYPNLFARGLSSDLLGTSGIPTAEEYVNTLWVRENRLASFFGRINYTLRDRYTLSASMRRDGSSRFGPDNQWGTFPAAAVAWRLSEEDFLTGSTWLSDLKLRASWGVNGNQAIGDYLWAADYRYGGPFARVQFGDEFVTTIRPGAVDPGVKWEETTSYNIGLDYGLFADRVSGSLEYYLKDTDDLLFRVPVAAGTYLSNYITTNIGSIRNQGVELVLNGRILEGGDDGVSWTANFNAARNRNELLSINPFGGGGEQILVGGIAGGVGSNIQVLQPGFPVNSFFVLQHRRDASGKPIYSDNPLEMYMDLNNDGVINQNDRRVYQDPAPNWIFGHTSQLGYRRLDLSLTLLAQLGNYVYNNVASAQGYYNRLLQASGPVNLHASVLDHGFVEPQFFSDVYVEDASFLRMSNLSLGYTVPQFRGAQQLRLFGTVQNVFTLTGYSGVDPTAGLVGIDNFIYPRSRIFSAGVSFGF